MSPEFPQAKLKEPEFKSDNFFYALFYRNPKYALKDDAEKITDKTVSGEKDGVKVGEKDGVKVGEKLTLNQQKIMEFIAGDPFISAKKLSETVKISQRKIEENISKLKARGLLRRIGPDKGGHWEAVRQGLL